MSNKLINIGEKIKKENKNLLDYTYICPDDRKYIIVGNLIKYISIKNLKKINTGKVINISLDTITLKSLNSNITWTIKFADNHIFYKFYKDNLIDALNELFEKTEKK